jgi:hypothetical protein
MMTIRRYTVSYVVDTGDDEHAHDAIIDALDSLRAKEAFTDLLIQEIEDTACVVCLVQDVLIKGDER